jgi:4-amino-4-deoxy-L-arabinose transferase-like glycosyltransferase
MFADHSTTSNRQRDIRNVTGLVLLCAIVVVPGMGSIAMWDPDEGLHAAISKDMVLSGDWITPQANGEPFFDKPPLFTWFVALSFMALGFTELAARLPAALIGIATVLVVYLFGRRMFGTTAALLGAVVLATSAEQMVLARTVVHDISLSLFVTLALLAFYRAYIEERYRRRYLVLAYASVGAAVLSKGPIGLLLPVAISGIFLVARRDLGFVRKAISVPGALVFLAVAAPWYVAVSLANESYLAYFLLEKNLGSFSSEVGRHPEPFYHYVPVIILGFLPWSWFLLLAMVRSIRRRSAANPARLFALIWFGFVFVFFSMASSKLETYLLPLFPAGAFLVGELWSELLSAREKRPRTGLLISYALLIITLLAEVVVVWGRLGSFPEVRPDLHVPLGATFTAINVASVTLMILFLVRRNYRALFATTTASMVAVIVLFCLLIAPALDPYKSTKSVAQEIDLLLAPGESITVYRELRPSTLFYTDRKVRILHELSELDAYLARAGALCLIDRKKMKKTDSLEDVQSPFRIVEEDGPKLIVEGLGTRLRR